MNGSYFPHCCQIYVQGAVGLAIWVPSVTKQTKEIESSEKRVSTRGYSSLSPPGHKDGASWRYDSGDKDLELSEVVTPSDRESNYEDNLLEKLKVPISPSLLHLPLSLRSLLFIRILILDVPAFQVSKAMSKNYLKVPLSLYLKDALKYMKDNQQNCALVVDKDDLLEGILTNGDIKRYLFKKYGDTLKSESLSVRIDNA